MSGNNSRRSSSSTSPGSSQPPTPTSKSAPFMPNFTARKSLTGSTRKINPVRRCQSMRYPNLKSGSINSTSTTSLRARRVSSIPASLENGKSGSTENDFVKYYQYKTSKADPLSLINICIVEDLNEDSKHQAYRVLVVGSLGVGKSSIVSQFENFIEARSNNNNNRNIYGYSNGYKYYCNGDQKDTLKLHFKKMTSSEIKSCLDRSPITVYQPDGYIIVFAVNDRESFEAAKASILEIFKWDDAETKPIILVANKTDLVRSRVVSKQEGRQLAINNNCKYIEISCAISHKVDFLLAGLGAQLNLKHNTKQSQLSTRKPNIFKRLLRKAALNKSKSCDNLHVL